MSYTGPNHGGGLGAPPPAAAPMVPVVAANGAQPTYHYQTVFNDHHSFYTATTSQQALIKQEIKHDFYQYRTGAMTHLGGHQQHYFAPSSLNVPLREPSPEPVMVKEEPSTSEEQAALAAVKNFEEEDFDEDGEIEIKIRNVVCNYTLPLHIDLRTLALNINNVTYDRGKGVLLKQKRNPNCYIKVYSSGKVYIVGCKTEEESMRAARTMARKVQCVMNKMNQRVAMRNYRVSNVLATCRMPFGIKIEEMAQKYPAQSQYEPELSVGLVWKMTEPKAVLRVHTTGSITVVGATSEAAVAEAISLIYPIVREFRCAKRGRGENAKPTRKRKRRGAAESGPPRRRVKAEPDDEGSFVVGNRVVFGDEDDNDDFYGEGDLVDDDEDD